MQLEFEGNRDKEKVYRRKDDSNKLSDIQLENVEYTFIQDRLTSVRFLVRGKSNREQVLKALQYSYGTGTETFIGRSWEGNIVRMSYMLGVDSEKGGDIGICEIISKKMLKDISDSKDQDQESRVRKAASDL
ncbi:hypothetical protein [Hymenobacter canadensis]|uniref:Uncharacterized protein n=1 Tax=Hymenobacter canadensis TaxID=2999067 RepID=A0ABY7LS00_9BACT|nr:hypothetical protein [Hymenobacter canadensis]WBA43188.1 hypothetical protein O3303_06390 [Hymenobacter canadensis]